MVASSLLLSRSRCRERVRQRRIEKLPPLASLLWWFEGGGTCLNQMLCPAVVSCFFEAVWLLSATPAAPGTATVCRVLLHRTMPLFEDMERKPSLLDPSYCHRHTHIHRDIHEYSHTSSHSYNQNQSQSLLVTLWYVLMLWLPPSQ